MKEKAIEIVKNLTKTIDKINTKTKNVFNLNRDDMFATPTISKSRLESKRKELIDKYNLKTKEWKY